jgi:uncharacterized protein YyaL (SSP411 family)
MLSALACAHQVLQEARYLEAAQRAARYLLRGMRQPDGSLYATARAGRAHLDACLDDYIFTIQGLIDLYESDFDPTWLREALALSELVEQRFTDRERGGYCTTGAGHEPLIARMKTVHDGALPAGTGVQVLNLLRLSELCGRADLRSQALSTINAQATLVNRHPRAFSHLLLAVDFLERVPREVVVSGTLDDPGTRALLQATRATFLPQRVVALANSSADAQLCPLIEGRQGGGKALAYVCRNYTCDAPVDNPEALREALLAR